MKKLSIILLLIAITNFATAQIKTEVFILNLGEPAKDASLVENQNGRTDNSPIGLSNENSNIKLLVLPTQRLLAFRLINGNPYKYKYVINHRLVNFFEGQVNNPLDIDSIVFSHKNWELLKIPTPDSVKLTELEQRADSIRNDINKLKEDKRKGFKNMFYESEIEEKNRELSKALDKIKNLKAQLLAGQYISKSDKSYQIIERNKSLRESLFITPISAKNKEDDEMTIQNAYIIMNAKLRNQKLDIDQYISSISAEDFLDKDSFIKKRKEFDSAYNELSNDIRSINNEAIEFKDKVEEFKKNSDDLNKILLEIKTEITKMHQLKLHNYLLPIDINGKNIDVVEITIERYDKTANNPTTDKYSYNIWIRGGIKIDISGGLFITSLLDKEYSTKDIVVSINGKEETHKLIYEKNKGDYDFGFGSTINLSLRGGSWVRPSLSIGTLFTADQKFQILSGLGIIIGKQERIVLTGGLTMGSISQISDNFKVDGITSYDLGTSGQVPLANKFTFGHFFGVTYNFGKLKTLNNAN